MIIRKWHGYTSRDDADKYERLLKEEIIPEIEAKEIIGYRSFQVLRRDINSEEVEFITLIKFENISSVKDFVGENYEEVYVPEKAKQVLKSFNNKAIHYDLIYETDQGDL